jgi:hypothetical protein
LLKGWLKTLERLAGGWGRGCFQQSSPSSSPSIPLLPYPRRGRGCFFPFFFPLFEGDRAASSPSSKGSEEEGDRAASSPSSKGSEEEGEREGGRDGKKERIGVYLFNVVHYKKFMLL